MVQAIQNIRPDVRAEETPAQDKASKKQNRKEKKDKSAAAQEERGPRMAPLGSKAMKQIVQEYGPNEQGSFDAQQLGEKVGEFCAEFAKRHEEKKARREQRPEKANDKPKMTREERAEYKNTKKNRAVVTGKPE